MNDEAPSSAPDVASAKVALDDVVITDQLQRRRGRTPNYRAECEALHTLAQQIAADPQAVLQNLADVALRLSGAGSAGVSLLERAPGGQERLRIAAASGAFAKYLNADYPREGSLCGHCLDQRTPQLYSLPGRLFPAVRALEPVSVEHLVLCFACGGEHVGTVWAIGHDDAKRFDAEDVRLLSALADFSGAALVAARRAAEQARAAEALRRAERTSRFLADASAALAALDDAERTLAKVAELAVPEFADWCAVDLVDGEALRRVEVAHVDPSKVELAHEIYRRFPPDPADPRGTWSVVRTGQSVLIPEITDEMLVAAIDDPVKLKIVRDLGLTSYIGVPLKVRDKALGVLTFASSDPKRLFDETDLSIAEDLARRAAVAVENVHLYDEAAEAARRKDEFLAMLGHELRNPLAPIRSGLELLALSGIESDVVEMMSGQVDHLVRLVDDLLDVSRILRGRVQFKRTTVDLADVVRRAVETVRPMTTKAKQELHIELPTPSPVIDADPVRLTQVFSNLLHNASKYGSPAGRITVHATLEGDSVVTRVIDDGIGIDAELLPRVFELFTRSGRDIDRSQGGLGLGLTIVKNLVEMHGGSVAVHSEGPGKGSEFAVRLPVREGAKTPVAPIEPVLETACRRILVVDDNVPAAKLLVRLLDKLGSFEVVTRHDGESALAAAASHRPDLIILDIGMPKMDGYEVARRLRGIPETADTALVALTGYGSPEDRQAALDAGFDEHFVKPPGVEMLRQALSHPKLSGR